MVSETKLDCSFPDTQFIIEGCAPPFRHDRNSNGGGILLFLKEEIEGKTINKSLSKDFKVFSVELNLHKKKILLCCSYNPHNSNIIANYLDILGKTSDIQMSKYHNFLVVGDFNLETSETVMSNFYDV